MILSRAWFLEEREPYTFDEMGFMMLVTGDTGVTTALVGVRAIIFQD